jgi:hypothetical protein
LVKRYDLRDKNGEGLTIQDVSDHLKT